MPPLEWRLLGTITFGLLHWPGQNPAIIFIGLAVLFQLIMRYTIYGKHCYAIGSNEEAARMSGIKVDRHKVLVYTIAGMLAALAGDRADARRISRRRPAWA